MLSLLAKPRRLYQAFLLLLLSIHATVSTYQIAYYFTLEQIAPSVSWIIAGLVGITGFLVFWLFALSIKPADRLQVDRRDALRLVGLFGLVFTFVCGIAGVTLLCCVLVVSGIVEQIRLMVFESNYYEPNFFGMFSRVFSSPLLAVFAAAGGSLYVICMLYIFSMQGESRPRSAYWLFAQFRRVFRSLLRFARRYPDWPVHVAAWSMIGIYFWSPAHFAESNIEKTLFLVVSVLLLYLVMLCRLHLNTVVNRLGHLKFLSPMLVKQGFGVLLVLMFLAFLVLEVKIGVYFDDTRKEDLLTKSSFYLNLVLIGLGIFLAVSERSHLLNQERIKTGILNEKIAQERNVMLRAQLQLLNSQINSHFFFNSLNFLYRKGRDVSDVFARSILLLSDIISYALKAARPYQEGPEKGYSNVPLVPLGDELDHIRNYIDFGRLTATNPIYIEFNQSALNEPFSIIPLLLVTFVENALKFGEIHDPDNPVVIDIAVDYENLLLHFKVRNKKRVLQADSVPSTGLGLANTKRRLEIEYPGAHQFKVIDSETHFTAQLSLQL